jgi:hypothetical protein
VNHDFIFFFIISLFFAGLGRQLEPRPLQTLAELWRREGPPFPLALAL